MCKGCCGNCRQPAPSWAVDHRHPQRSQSGTGAAARPRPVAGNRRQALALLCRGNTGLPRSPTRDRTAPIDLQRLHHKTEGWIAGLWLASAALAHRDAKAEFVDRFGIQPAVADYLTEEVLNLQAAEVRSFLLRTSILKTLSPALCRMLVPGVDAEDLLRKLEAENILITRIDGEERSFRYHSLFIGFLRAQLARELPDEIPQLHRAAARWFESQQRPVPAIEHALEGDDLEHAIAMLEAHAMGLLAAGRMRLLSRWFENIPQPPSPSMHGFK